MLSKQDPVRVSFHKKGWMDEKGKNLSHFISNLTGNSCFAQMTDRHVLSIYSYWVLLFILGVKEWIRTCLPRNPRAEQSLLVWDSFLAHLTESLKADLQRHKIDVAVIPGSLTPVLHPLDKCLNKPFNDNLQRKYLNWMMAGHFEYTPVGKKKAPSKNLVLRCVRQS